jgi:small subunit ribosomal protein S21
MGGVFLGVATIIKAKKDEPAASVIRRFKKQVLQDGVLKDLKKKEYYVKPSQVKKEKRKEWERQKRRIQRMQA